jgi:dethiobiotin synthetase
MSGRLIVIAGTGTSIGKTHFAEALLRAWTAGRPRTRVAGIKPIESGLAGGTVSDAARLAAVSTFHVKQFGYTLSAPLSPHLAARDEGIEIRIPPILDAVRNAVEQADGVVVELAGGLFTPLAPDVCNAHLAVALAPETLLLVAPDRLGVLHDVAAATRAASTLPLRIDGLVMVAPEHRDPSTGRNAQEAARVSGVPVVAVVPRASSAELAHLPAIRKLVGR